MINLFDNLLGLGRSLVGALPARSSAEATDLALTRLHSEFNGSVTRLAQGLADGAITPDEFEIAMRAEIRSNELGSAVLGAGGAHLATPETYQNAQTAVDQQMTFFDQWMAQIRANGVLPEDANALATRARLYGAASTQTFERAQKRRVWACRRCHFIREMGLRIAL